jgi:hypothetical protein
MTYNPNIPQANDDPTASQSDLLGNFGKLNSDWAVNHVPLTSGGNNGLHKLVQFPNVLGSDPSVTGLQSVVYPKAGADANPALFFENALKVFQLTNLPIVTSGTNFGVVTPWGFTINFGQTIFTASTMVVTNFAIPMTNNVILTAQLTRAQFFAGSSASPPILAINGTSFTTFGSLLTNVFYVAMGY